MERPMIMLALLGGLAAFAGDTAEPENRRAQIGVRDPLIAGIPGTVSLGPVREGVTVFLVINDGHVGAGPCAPGGSPCLSLVGPYQVYGPEVSGSFVGGETSLVFFEVVPPATQFGAHFVARDPNGDWHVLGPYAVDAQDPALVDSDADTLSDAEELALGTNRLRTDTDGGGMRDDQEIRFGTNPLDGSDDAEQCTNNRDDDDDGRVDCADADCLTHPTCGEDCANGTDDDGDGFLDCRDDECWGSVACGSTVVTIDGGEATFRSSYASIRRRSTSSVVRYDSTFEGDRSLELSDVTGHAAVYDAGGTIVSSCDFEIESARMEGIYRRRVAPSTWSSSGQIGSSFSDRLVGWRTMSATMIPGAGCTSLAPAQVLPRVPWPVGDDLAHRPGAVWVDSLFGAPLSGSRGRDGWAMPAWPNVPPALAVWATGTMSTYGWSSSDSWGKNCFWNVYPPYSYGSYTAPARTSIGCAGRDVRSNGSDVFRWTNLQTPTPVDVPNP